MSDDGGDGDGDGNDMVNVENENMCERLGNAIFMVLVGIVLFLGMFPLLFWNERRSVERYTTLKQGEGITVAIDSLVLETQNVGKLVYIEGLLQASSSLPPLIDPIFGITGYQNKEKTAAASTSSVVTNEVTSSNSSSSSTVSTVVASNGTDTSMGNDDDDTNRDGILKLMRQTTMFQWEQYSDTNKRKKLGGGTETVKTTKYRKVWSDSIIASSTFKKQTDHQNPYTSMPYQNLELVQEKITVGPVYQVPTQSLAQINWYEQVDAKYISKEHINNAVLREGNNVLVYENGFYIGYNNNNNNNNNSTTTIAAPNVFEPTIGDIRVTFETVDADSVSIVAKQENAQGVLTPYQTTNGGSILLFERGELSIATMYEKGRNDNQLTTWIIRIVGYALMACAIYLCLSPLEVVADVIPFLGDLVGCGLICVAMVFASFFAGTTIALAWLIYHPLIGIIILLIIVCCSGSAFFALHKTKAENTNKKSQTTSKKGVNAEDQAIQEAENAAANVYG